MNFLYDLIASQPTSDGNFHGGGKYAKTVFIALVLFNKNFRNIYGLFDSTKGLDNEIKTVVEVYNITLIDVRSQLLQDIFTKYSINRYYSALPYNIGFNFLDVLKLNCDVIVTIHGMRGIETPLGFQSLQYAGSLKEKIKNFSKILLQFYFRKRDFVYYQQLLEKVKVITVSNHSKYNLLLYFPKSNSDINVFYAPDVTERIDISEKIDLKEKDYFLMVSGNRWIKNNLRSAIALDQIFTARKEIKNKVIITGVTNKQIYLNRIKNKERFIFYDYVSENLLSVLYKQCYSFLYMTLNEGFGYPPLEAMKYGVPVIASPHTAVTEVCGNAVLYANPYSIDEIKNRILQLVSGKGFYQELKEIGRNRFLQIKVKQEEDLREMINFLLD